MRTTIQVAGVVIGLTFVCVSGFVGVIGALVCFAISVFATLYGVEECGTKRATRRAPRHRYVNGVYQNAA